MAYVNYREYIASNAWRKKARELKKKVKRCQKCGTKKRLVVHHANYTNIPNEKSGDLVVLCWKDHNRYHYSYKLKADMRGDTRAFLGF